MKEPSDISYALQLWQENPETGETDWQDFIRYGGTSGEGEARHWMQMDHDHWGCPWRVTKRIEITLQSGGNEPEVQKESESG